MMILYVNMGDYILKNHTLGCGFLLLKLFILNTLFNIMINKLFVKRSI